MRKIAAIVLLIAAYRTECGQRRRNGIRHRAHYGHGCGFGGRFYRDGEFCTLECRFASCISQTCHRGRWVIPPATCPAGWGCSQFC